MFTVIFLEVQSDSQPGPALFVQYQGISGFRGYGKICAGGVRRHEVIGLLISPLGCLHCDQR